MGIWKVKVRIGGKKAAGDFLFFVSQNGACGKGIKVPCTSTKKFGMSHVQAAMRELQNYK